MINNNGKEYFLKKMYTHTHTHTHTHILFLVAQTVKSLPAMRETWVRSLGWEDSRGGGHDNPLQCSCPENSMDRGAWQGPVHRVSKSQTRLSDYYSLSPKLRCSTGTPDPTVHCT